MKYGNNEDWHEWIKMHLVCGVRTHIVTGVELSNARTHDAPYFKPLLDQTAKAGFTMQEVSADKGYISYDNLQAVGDHGATPYMPFKTNVTGKRGPELWEKAIPLLQLQTRRVSCSLSQAFQRRDDVQHDKSEVWRAATE